MTNLFVHRSAAQRYAASRPYFHPIVVDKIAMFTGCRQMQRALDVACGTGQSARALTDIAESVDAVDISPEMLAEAEAHDRVRFQIASAEKLPFADASFDIITVGLAYHWFDQNAFLCEAVRVLRSDGWLGIYTSGFHGEMEENPSFRHWAWEVYPSRFPTPPRRSASISDETVRPQGFCVAGTEDFIHDEEMTCDQLTGYLLTQTNVIAAVENGVMPVTEAAEWIFKGVQPFFSGQIRKMKFGGSIWYLRRAPQSNS
jgi:SAM-dependent methyltransferase